MNTALWGAAVIGASCALTGAAAVASMKNRTALLRQFISICAMCCYEIGENLTSTPDLLYILIREFPEMSAFFEQTQELWDSAGYIGFSAAWGESLSVISGLTQDDKLLINEIGTLIGRYDAQSQASALARVGARLEQRYTEACGDKSHKSRLYYTLGIAGGLAVFIMLM